MLTKAQIKRRVKSLFGVFTQIGLKNKGFSILSNNCWGGAVYDHFHLPYKTPTIGLWMTAEDYLRFLADLPFYLKQELTKISWQDCHAKELLLERKRRGKYQFELDELNIGRLHDVDIVFLHYHSFDDAKRKWNYRKDRINKENLIVKFNDQNGFSMQHYAAFMALPYKNKLFFTARKELAGEPNVIYVNEPDWDGSIKDDTKLSLIPFNLKTYLNGLRSSNS